MWTQIEAFVRRFWPGHAAPDHAARVHFPDVKLSCWQSAVADVAARGADGRDASHPWIVAATTAASTAHDAPPHRAPFSAARSAAERLESCAKLALEWGLAEISGDPLQAKELSDYFRRYGGCDLGWEECVAQFKHYYRTAATQKAYTPWQNLTDFTFDDLPDKGTIAIIGDWGTGQHRALELLKNVAAHTPDLIIHLGDIYYACTDSETAIFLRQVERAFPAHRPRLLSLCGNHDMYSGGVAYQALLASLGQPASFFCLRNAHWQILAGDTGFNDFDPAAAGTIASCIQDHDDGAGYSELDWHRHKFATAGGRRTLLFTHHQPFTRNSPIEGTTINVRLLSQFAPHLGDVALWLWGHEHNQVVYAPYRDVAKGRCVGASAVPVPGSQAIYDVPKVLAGQAMPARLSAAGCLGIDRKEGLYNLGYALIDLDGAAARATYYEFDTSRRKARVLFAEDL